MANTIGTHGYMDLGDGWIRYQTARLCQRHLQVGRRCRPHPYALLARAAAMARLANTAAMLEVVSIDHIRRATIEAIEYCARLSHPVRVADGVVDRA
jgi:hypothetical protein